MSTNFRNSRPSRSYWFRSDELPPSVPVLAPDITTAPPAPSTMEILRAQAQAKAKKDTSILEARHPEIVRAIGLLWGFPEMNEYFNRLWLADGSHEPIDPDAMSELMFLSRLHLLIVPHRPGRSLASIYGNNRLYDSSSTGHDTWSDIPYRR